MACALKNGKYGIADMDPPNLSEDIVALIGKTELIPDETMEDRARGIRGARLEIVKKNGETVEETVLVPKGDPENPLTRADIIEKLKVCAQGQADEALLKRLVDEIVGMGDGSAASAFSNPMALLMDRKGVQS